VHGPPEACRERLQQYVEAGVATPILALIPVGGDVRETVRALGPAVG
jgi:alkanesulfonate monooxygenase SsuD/methylene tetrahydromethanopterin reductase-like flavin-dependent oxidoreductase (luciferase family)